MLDETCSGFSNYATFTVAVNIENRKPLADLVETYVSLYRRSDAPRTLADALACSASIQALMRQENVDESKVNWEELADHLSTK